MGFILKGGKPINQFEAPAKASEDIKPGMLVAVSAGELIKHATAGGNAKKQFAGDPMNQQAVGATYAATAAYADGEQVPVLIGPGMQIHAWLEDGASVAKGAPLESGGNGQLQAHTAGDETTAILHDRIVAHAAETLDNGAGGAPAWILVDVD